MAKRSRQPVKPGAIQPVGNREQPERGESDRHGIESGYPPEGNRSECPSAIITAFRDKIKSSRFSLQQSADEEMRQFVQNDTRQARKADHGDMGRAATAVDQEQRDDQHDSTGMPPERDVKAGKKSPPGHLLKTGSQVFNACDHAVFQDYPVHELIRAEIIDPGFLFVDVCRTVAFALNISIFINRSGRTALGN